jgi:hypothetical protein
LLGKLEEKISSLLTHSANPKQVATGIVRGAFEFQGQNVQQLQDLTYQKFMASD